MTIEEATAVDGTSTEQAEVAEQVEQEAVEAEPVEQEAKEEAPQDKKQQRFSSAFAKLVKREQEIRRREHEVESLRRQIDSVRSQFQAEAEHIERVRRVSDLAAKDPLAAIREMGHDPDRIFHQWAMANLRGEKKNEQTEQLRLELEELKRERAAEAAKHRQRETERLVEEEMDQLSSWVKSDKCKFETLKAFDPDQVAVDMFNARAEHWRRTNAHGRAEVLSEEKLGEALDKQYRRIVETTEGLRAALQKKKPTSQEDEADGAGTSAARTLSAKRHTASTRTSKRLSPKEREERAILRLRELSKE